MLEGIKRVVIITGASRGIGARLVVDLNEKWKSDTLFILIARDYAKLEEIKKELLEKSPAKNNLFFLLKIDFSDSKNGVDEYKKYLTDLLNLNELNKQLNEIYVFYNHGTLELMPIEEAADISTEFYQTNVISVWKFLSAIRTLFPIRNSLNQYHINTSSKMAYMNIPSYSLYSSCKTFIYLLRI
jgi:short-subunit dehydrogenase